MVGSDRNDDPVPWKQALAVVCLTWYIFIVLVSTLGYVQLRRWYSTVPGAARSPRLPVDRVPHVTILRPVKGHEPYLYECLAATFHQDYPSEKLTIHFCVSSREDAAYPTLERLVRDHPGFDAKIFVEAEDPDLRAQPELLGPNPKIRNTSRGYREAKGDILWTLDCNVWVGGGVAGRMVDRLCGLGSGSSKKYKFVHHLPLVVDVGKEHLSRDERSPQAARSLEFTVASSGGGRLEELFMSSSHAKFYTAINTVLVAPCIVGKSNMFRRSHLNHLTAGRSQRRPGIDFFSDNICEDHLIGDVLWRQRVIEEARGERWGKHALVFGDLAIQPMAGMSVADYVARRVRWLRVRKFTVILATLVEPGTESFLCSFYGAYAITTMPCFREQLGVPPTWWSFCVFWLVSVACWSAVDWSLYLKLHSAATVEESEHVPPFARPPVRQARRPYREWLSAWLAREALALPIWTWAFWGGSGVEWRGERFRVGMDMRVHKVGGDAKVSAAVRKNK